MYETGWLVECINMHKLTSTTFLNPLLNSKDFQWLVHWSRSGLVVKHSQVPICMKASMGINGASCRLFSIHLHKYNWNFWAWNVIVNGTLQASPFTILKKVKKNLGETYSRSKGQNRQKRWIPEGLDKTFSSFKINSCWKDEETQWINVM